MRFCGWGVGFFLWSEMYGDFMKIKCGDVGGVVVISCFSLGFFCVVIYGVRF